MNGPTGLHGGVRLRPGQTPAVQVLGAQGWLGRLAQGRPAGQLPELMARVHTLCAAGHRLAAGLALRAARGERAGPTPAERDALALAVARDHLLRIAHDWPRLLPAGGGTTWPLDGCPPWHAEGDPSSCLAALAAWLQARWLDRPVAGLLAALADDPAAAALRWARSHHTPLARLLARELPPALALATAHRPLPVPPPAQVPAADVPDTGPWCRAHDTAPAPAHNAGMRLVARLVDLLRLAAPGGREWLRAAAAPVADGHGQAWVEVGRGLLAYDVTLKSDSGPPVVQRLRVRSPTDWNLHPQGVLAQALAGVDDAAAATRLAVAFDPCVPFEIEATEAAGA